MHSGKFLSRLQLVLSMLTAVIVFLFLPLILRHAPRSDIEVVTLRMSWLESGLALPAPTVYALVFSDHFWARLLGLAVLLAAGGVVEWCGRDSLKTGLYHTGSLVGCLILGTMFFLACLLPGIPL